MADSFTGRLHADAGPGVIGDLAYIGTGMLTGYKRINGGWLSASEREFNRSINSWRASVERAIAHLRNWKMGHQLPRLALVSTAKLKDPVVAV